MAVCRRVAKFSKKGHYYIYKLSSSYCTTPSIKKETGPKEIIIPFKVERGPTDILKALSSTISKDHTAAHYKYEDDPYFIPVSNITKRSFALSKEAGKKAARYFLEKYPELFKCNQSVPHIKDFDPPVTYSENDEVTENILKKCILNHDVQNSIDVLKLLTKKGLHISQETKQDLLDLLCFYNSTPPPSDDYYEERFFQRNDDTPSQKWNSKSSAEQLFEGMKKDGKAYSSIIAGLSKYGDSERALFLHDEMKSKGLVGTLHAYNCLISECHLIHEDSNAQWEQAMFLLNQMNADNIKPDLYTMNALFRILTKASRWKKAKQLSLQVLAEMKRLEIEPSLGTYYYLLRIFASSDAESAGILYEILNEIENKEYEIRHPTDVLFFATAMEACWKSLNDRSLAYRVHNLLEYKKNCKLLGNALAENHYFKCFFRLLSETEDIDKLMELYEKYVPNSYTPEPIVTLSVIQAVHFVGEYQYLPKLCSDVLLFEQTERTNILEVLLEAAACTKNEEQIQLPLIEMVWNIIEKLNVRSKGRRQPFEWSGPMLSNALKTFINGKDLEKSWSIINKLEEEKSIILGCPDKNYLLEFCQMCLEFDDYKKIIFCMKYAVNGYFPDFQDDLINMVEQLFDEQKLNEKQLADIKANLHAFENVVDDSYDVKSSSGSSSSSESSSDSSSDDEKEKP